MLPGSPVHLPVPQDSLRRWRQPLAPNSRCLLPCPPSQLMTLLPIALRRVKEPKQHLCQLPPPYLALCSHLCLHSRFSFPVWRMTSSGPRPPLPSPLSRSRTFFQAVFPLYCVVKISHQLKNMLLFLPFKNKHTPLDSPAASVLWSTTPQSCCLYFLTSSLSLTFY